MMSDSRVAIYPGSFDPITLGHEDVARRALAFADRVVVAVAHSPSQTKRGMFSVTERLEIMREVFASEPAIEVDAFSGLLVNYANSRGATLLVRGLRTVADFEYELRMALMNRQLSRNLETLFLAPSAETSFISSSLVREIATLGGEVGTFLSAPVHARVIRHLESVDR